jgi:hypothetical protein
MANESYNDYLTALNLQAAATEDEIRMAILSEQRKWNQKLTAPQIERRQEADRRLKALADAEAVLLGPEGAAVRLVRQGGGGAAPGGASPISQSYRHHLALLNLPNTATEEQIRSSLAAEQRRWMEKTNSTSMDLKQEAERKIHALDQAAQVLLGSEGVMFRSGGGAAAPTADNASPVVDAQTIARAIERVATARGAKSQERDGPALLKTATVFHKGVDYRLEEIVHKKFESIKDARILTARRGAAKLFEWVLSPIEPASQPSVRVNTAGSWVSEIVALAATLQAS